MSSNTIVEIKTEDGVTLLFETTDSNDKQVNDIENTSEGVTGYVGARTKRKVEIDQKRFREKIDALAALFKPDEEMFLKKISEVQVECGIKIATTGNIIIASGSAEGALKLTLKFT